MTHPKTNFSIGFVKIEVAIIDSPVLTKEDRAFYMALKRFRNRKSKRCFPSMAKVAKRAGICKETAYRCRTKLKELGIIRWRTERGRKHSCHYDFILEDGNLTEISIALENLE